MGDVISLSEYRKKRAQDRKAKKARENRARYGRSGAGKAADRADRDKVERDLDQKLLGGRSDDDADSSREPPEGTSPTAS